MKWRKKRARALQLDTPRFRLVPVEPISFSLRTFGWTADGEALASMNWRIEGWTRFRWWRLLRRYARRKHMCHGIWPKEGGEPIGLHITTLDDRNGNATLAVFLGDRQWWGKGVVGECRLAILEDCFGRLGAARASGFVNARNFASIYNYQKLGFTREAVLRKWFAQPEGGRTDQLAFGLLREEWEARPGRNDKGQGDAQT
jgi:RimJ/RimL family protein N-acetyltransferase